MGALLAHGFGELMYCGPLHKLLLMSDCMYLCINCTQDLQTCYAGHGQDGSVCICHVCVMTVVDCDEAPQFWSLPVYLIAICLTHTPGKSPCFRQTW